MTLFKSNVFVTVTAFSLLCGPAAFAYTGQNLAKSAKIGIAHARVIAMKARAGKVTDQELEREPGGSGLRYSFDIRAKGKTFEVGVDAASGKVLENAAEGPHPD